jgi:6-phosphogluconolactonase/glucosamine-6-phosphate isomerase/deaminase
MQIQRTYSHQMSLFPRSDFSTYGEMIRRTSMFGPQEFDESAARKIASRIVDFQRSELNRPVNISFAPGQTIVPVLGQLAELGTIDRSLLLSSTPQCGDHLASLFRNPEEETLVFKNTAEISAFLENSPADLKTAFTPLFERSAPFLVEWSNIRFFHMVELFEQPLFQYRENMVNWFFGRLPESNCIPKDQIHYIDINSPGTYPDLIAEKGGIDLGVLGIGENSHIAFNEPGLELKGSIAQVRLSDGTIEHLKPLIPAIGTNPDALTLTTWYIINNFAKIILIAAGHNKSSAIKHCLFNEQAGPGSVSTVDFPAFALRFHPRKMILLDTEAASGLKPNDIESIREAQGDARAARILMEDLGFRKTFNDTQVRTIEKSLSDKYLGYTISSRDIAPILEAFVSANLPAEQFDAFVEEKIFDYYLRPPQRPSPQEERPEERREARTGILNKDPFEKQKLAHFFRHVLRVFRFPHIADRVTERKKLISDIILMNVVSKAYINTASEMRRNLAIETVFKHAVQHHKASNHQPGLETVFELIATQMKTGGTSVFFSFIPMIRRSDDVLRTASLIFDLLLRAKEGKVELFCKDHNLGHDLALTPEEFFKISCRITLMIAASSERINDALMQYFLAASMEHPEGASFVKSITDAFLRFKLMHSTISEVALDQSEKAKILYGMHELLLSETAENNLRLVSQIRDLIAGTSLDDSSKLKAISGLCDSLARKSSGELF